MQIRLKVVSGSCDAVKRPLSGKTFLFGRGEDCNIRPRGESISHHHCVITVSDDRVFVNDLNSDSGTLVNEQPIEGEHTFEAGDCLRVGDVVFEVRFNGTTVKKGSGVFSRSAIGVGS